MKRKNIVLGLVTLLCLGGCKNAYTSVSDAKEVLITIGDKTVVKGDLYNSMLVADGANASLELMMNFIMEKEVPVDEAIKTEAQKQVDDYKELLGEYMEDFLTNNGLKSEEDLIGQLIPSIQQNKLVGKYVNEKFSVLATTQKPKMAQVMQFSEEEKAKEALDKVIAGSDFEEVATELSSKTFNGAKTVYIANNTALDKIVLAAISSSTAAQLNQSVITGSDAKFYVVNIVDGDPENFKEEAITAIAADATIQNDAMRYYLKEYNFKISDKLIYDLYKESYPDFIFE